MLVYKPKLHSEQYTGLKYVIYIEMTDQKFSPTSQCHKTTILHMHIMFKNWKTYIAWCLPQQPVNAGSRKIGVKTAKPGVEYTSL